MMRPSLVLALVAALPGLALAAIEDQHRPKAKNAPPPPQPVLTKAPELVQFAGAAYPEDLLAKGVGGEAILLIDIDANGKVERVKLQSATEPGFAVPALVATSQFLFTPAEVDHKPSPIRIEYRYVFEPEIPEPDAIAGETEVMGVRHTVVNFTGLVREAGTRKPLPGAVITVAGRAVAETDADGRFAIRGMALGTLPVSVAGSHHETFETVEELREDERLEVKYYLVRTSTNPFETLVVGRSQKKEVARIQLQRQEVSKVPGTFGDPVRVIENLPGMARTPGGLGGALLVRGARPFDSRVFMDGVEVPMLYHFGGLTSIVNPEFLERVDFYPGGFGSRYGHATAGIVDVITRDLDCEMLRGSGDLSFLHAALYGCSPVADWSVAAAARRSHVDALLPIVLDNVPREKDEGFFTASPVYWDYQAKGRTVVGKHAFDVFVFGSDDRLKLIQGGSSENINIEVGLHTTFHRLVLRHKVRLGNNTTLTSSLAPGYDLRVFGQSAAEIGLDNSFETTIWNVDWREDFSTKVFDWLTVNAGLDQRMGYAEVHFSLPAPTDLRRFPAPTFDFTQSQQFNKRMKGYNHAYWLEAVLDLGGLKLIPGVRFDRFDIHHTQDMALQPRVTGRWEFIEGSTAKAAYGVYRKQPQPMYLLDSIGNPALPPESAQHIIVGFEQAFTTLVNLDLQMFYNLRRNLAVPSRSMTYSSGEARPEVWTPSATGRSYGLEVLLRHMARADTPFYGWVAYTLSRSLQRDRPKGATFFIEQPNGERFENPYSERSSNEYLALFDQTHILTIVAQTILPWGFEAGLRFRLVSGNPRTPLEKGYVLYDDDRDSYRSNLAGVPRNSARNSAFHQLDVRIDRTFTFDLWKFSVYLEVLNVYNAKNVEAVQYDYRFEGQSEVTLLPIVPILGLKGEF